MDPFKPYQPKSRRLAPPRLTSEDAATVALKALAFIAADESLLSAFVTASGCGPEDLRRRINDDAFLGAVLDFLLGDEAAVVAFSESAGFSPETPMLARMKLA